MAQTGNPVPLLPATGLSDGSYCSVASVIKFRVDQAGLETVDTEALQRHIRHLLDAGIAGFVLPGPSASGIGESSHRFRDEIIGAVASVTAKYNLLPDRSFKIPIIVPCGPCGDGVSGLDETILQSRWAMLYGATHCLVHPPAHLAKTQVACYFYEVTSRAGIPVVLCDNQQFSPGTPGLSSDTIVDIVDQCRSNFAGMILVGHDAGKIGRVVRGVRAKTRRGRVWIATSGSTDRTVSGLVLGANAVVSEMANLVPRTYVRIRNLWVSGDHDEATRVQSDLALAETWLERNLGEREGIMGAMPLFHGDEELTESSEVGQVLSLERKLQKGGGVLLY
ncbi:hypothetical protein V8F20_011255 [Naviculisporaceae sp. PSN 640]